MIKVSTQPGTNIVEMEFSGSISAAEFDQALEAFEGAIREHGTIKVLEVIGKLDMPPIPWSKMVEDIKFGFSHLKDITYCAVVTDQGWMKAWVKMLDPMFKAECRTFAMSELEAARAWLREV